jgi:hypothetical protein|tara:strand:- start:1178 stop:2008 length:831 start_codon:yes stop_codon:yes gene_type:complete
VANNIYIKSSQTEDDTPSSGSDFLVGEVAVNTYDGEIYVAKGGATAPGGDSTGVATSLMKHGGEMTGTLDMNNNHITDVRNFSFNGENVVSSIKDEDDMASDGSQNLATQQSIKAYVDAASTFYMNASFYLRTNDDTLYIVGHGDQSQSHSTGGEDLTSIDAEALMHGSFFQANRNTTFVGATGFIGTTSTLAQDLTVYFLLSDAYTSDQTGNFTISNVGSVSQSGALGANDAYYVTTTVNQAMTAGQVLLVGFHLGTGDNKTVSGSLTLEFKLTA